MKLLAITDVEQASEDAHLDAYHRLSRLVPVHVQLRDRRSAREVIAFGRRLMELGLPLVINDRIDVAMVLGVTRVHLGRASVSVADARRLLGPGSWVSCALHPGDRHDDAATNRRDEQTPDAWLASPIFASPGKTSPVGTSAIARTRALWPEVTLLALGGIDGKNARACLDAGADGVAVIRAALDLDAHDAIAHALR